jgi:hypothetical protein
MVDLAMNVPRAEFALSARVCDVLPYKSRRQRMEN